MTLVAICGIVAASIIAAILFVPWFVIRPLEARNGVGLATWDSWWKYWAVMLPFILVLAVLDAVLVWFIW